MSRERGRPRGFDIDTALDGALTVFWRHGFLDSSLSELTATMGLSKPSLYAAFGDKESLYLKALDRYVSQCIAPHVQQLMAEPNSYRAVAGFLTSLATMLTHPTLPGGCFIVTGAVDCGEHLPPGIDHALRVALGASEIRLNERLARALAEGDLPANTDVDELAGMFSALLAGFAIQARAGASTQRLQRLIANAMRAWPSDENGLIPQRASITS